MISTPDRQQAVRLIAVARTQGARLAPACAVVGITVRTHQRWTRDGGVREDQRPLIDRATPANALCAEETQAILDACHRPDHASLPPDQIVVRLLDQEALYLGSVSTFYRVLRRHGEVTYRGRAKMPKRQTRPTTYHAVAPNRLWSWDCTWLPGPVKGTYYYLVMIIDIFSRKVVGWEVFLGESADNAQCVLERAVLAEQVIQQPLVLHADNGSAFKAATLLEKLRDMNIEPSFSRPRVSNDNPYSEALFRTCKYVPTYPVNGFANLPIARDWVQGFVRWYNHEHRHSGIRFVTPAERHAGNDTAILNRRHALNEQARSRNPSRWSGKTRNWEPVGSVALNPALEPEITPLTLAA
ncbi:MAG: IS3 family transposase [Thiohalocapsa sp.]